MRIVVTGGLGFIGSNFVNHLNNNFNVDMLIVDNCTYASNRDNIPNNIPLLKKDICYLSPKDLGEYDYIVHFAAESHVDNSIINGHPFIKSNVEGTFNLIECAKQNPKLKKFIHISTDEVYGDMKDSYVINASASEENDLKPSSYYSASKASSDLLVLSAKRTYGLPFLITRTCNNFGENQNEEKFLPKIFKSIYNGLDIPVYGDGKQIREWIYVKDNVKIITDLMFDDNIINTVYNIGSGIHYSNIELIELISSITDKKVNVKFVTDRLGHDKVYRLRCNKLKEYYKNKGEDLSFLHIKDYLIKSFSNIKVSL
jgi:dTDP-glucose 4,6-dehydratase